MPYFCFRVLEVILNAKQSLVNMHRLNLREYTKIIEFWHHVKKCKARTASFLWPLWCPYA